MKYKAKDIARELGVSPATVSLVLNNRPGVGVKKRQEIIDKIIELSTAIVLFLLFKLSFVIFIYVFIICD